MDKLTTRQLEAFHFIHRHTEKNGFAPSLRELCVHMGYKAVGSAQDVIASLRRKGYLQVPAAQQARSLAITDRAKRHFKVAQTYIEADSDAFSIPKLGSVPAGHPVEAIQDHSNGNLKVSLSILPKPTPRLDQLFALQAQGLSMINAGILDGDWLVVKSEDESPAGAIVVAMVDNEATVKRLMRNKTDGWYLKPENPEFDPIYANDEGFQIVGRVIALQRTLH